MTKYFIDDVGVRGHHARLQEFGEIVCGKQMTLEIEEWSGWKNFNPATTLIVFPGNGADIVRSYISGEWLVCWRWTTVHAKRYWVPSEDPVVEVGRIFERGMLIGIKDIVLIDDVVSIGTTAKQLRRINEPWIPGARWHIVSWVAQRARSIRGFATDYATIEVGDQHRKMPINSLSTLISNVEIAGSYARRNFPNPEVFTALLNELR